MATARGRAEVSRYLERVPAELKKVLRGAGRAGGTVVAEEAKRLARSDEVRDKVTVTVKAEAERIDVRITVKPGWARAVGVWLEYGTDPHFITVDDSQRQGRSVGRINRLGKESDSSHSLVIGGKFVGSTVLHPGARPHPFLRPALDTQRSEAVAAAQAYIAARVSRRGIVTTDDGDDA